MKTEEQQAQILQDSKEELHTEAKKEGIDFGKLWRDVKKHKRSYFIVLPITLAIAIVYSLGLPNSYNCNVVLAPELTGGRNASSLSSLASSFGFNIGSSSSTGDAIMPMLYPELINSVTFHASLFPIKIHRMGENREMTYYDYLLKEQKSPWWTKAKKAVMGLIFGSGKKDEENVDNSVNTFQLTKEQTAIERAIGKLVVCDVDKKTMVITINVTDQDPLIAATIADSVQQKLQQFITDYRTNKAQNDVEHYETLFVEAKESYEKALHDFAYFSDHNQKVLLQSVRSQQTKLEAELGLRQQAYTQISAQLIEAKARLQEEKPAFTTLQPATVPIQKSGPSRGKICIMLLFLAFIGTTAYAFYKEGDLKALLGLGDGE